MPLSDPSADEARVQDENNITHNVTDEDLEDLSLLPVDPDVADVSRQVNKPVVSLFDQGARSRVDLMHT